MANAVRELIAKCNAHREAGRVESNIREEFVSYLRAIFPGETWVDHFILGGEAVVRTGRSLAGRASVGFIDTLVHSTVVEYESDIRDAAKRAEGMEQLRRYVAGKVRGGADIMKHRAVLSDFVEWEVYQPSTTKADLSALTADDIDLGLPIDQLNVGDVAEDAEQGYIDFLRANLGREGSRALRSDYLAEDVGLKSPSYRTHRDSLKTFVEAGIRKDSSAQVATALWSKYIDHLEGGGTAFRIEHYAAELYLILVARLLAANVLAKKPLRSADDDLASILNGSFFSTAYRLANFVERDYFGWIQAPYQLAALLPIAGAVQRDLAAYDYQSMPESELFGRLIGQLCEVTQRQLLGQVSTPTWLAKRVAIAALDKLPRREDPLFVDMCCGSGSILAEVLREWRIRWPGCTVEQLTTVITGFDVDPLAVTFAKTTWVMTLRDLLEGGGREVHIPVYHADSLFVVAPTAKGLPRAEGAASITVDLDGHAVRVPALLIEPQNRQLFDAVIDWAYDNAVAAARTDSSTHITEPLAASLVQNSAAAAGLTIPSAISAELVRAVYELAVRMAELAVSGRNGIWAFILRNTYMPALLAGQFNGIVSNPPWLTLSRIGNNPYQKRIEARTKSYGLLPRAQSAHHLEIATTFLMYAIDRYLKAGGVVAVIVPGKILDGDHQEPFRQRVFLGAERPVTFELEQVWKVDIETFNMPGTVVVGSKKVDRSAIASSPPAAFMASQGALTSTTLLVRKSGRRTSWVIGSSSPAAIGLGAGAGAAPPQGADLMPRSAVVVTVLDTSGDERRVRTPRPDDPFYYALGDGKQLKGKRFDGAAAKVFIYRMLQSKGVIPFAVNTTMPTIAIPIARKRGRALEFMSDTEIRAAGWRRTAQRFADVDAKYVRAVKKDMRSYLNTRSKLTKQTFPLSGYLVVGPPGGSNMAAAVIALDQTFRDVLIDQTLYWRWCESKGEAHFIAGFLNSAPLATEIDPFVTRGKWGKRHLHTAPWRTLPQFDSTNPMHHKISSLAEQLQHDVDVLVRADSVFSQPEKWLKAGRKRVTELLKASDGMRQLNATVTSLAGKA